MITVGSHVNGCTVLAVARRLRDMPSDELEGVVVLVQRDSDGEYITARMSPDVDTSWYWGNYLGTGTDGVGALLAWRDFAARVTE